MKRGAKVQGGEKEQKSKILPETLTPQLDTEPTAFRLRHISHQDRYVGIHPEETRSWFIQSELFNTTGSLLWMSFLYGVLNKGSAWETRSQSCIISFLGLGQETRKSPEGTLIRSRKQPKELSFSPTGKSTQPSKTSNFIWSLYLSWQTPGPPPPEPTQCICRLRTLSKQAIIFLSVNPNPTCKTPQNPYPEQSLDGLSPKGLSHLQHLKHLHCLVYLLVLQRGVNSPGAATSRRIQPFLELLLLEPMGRPTVRGIIHVF